MSKQKEAKVLITGASGLSGSIVVNEFLSQNISIRILVRNPDKVKHLKNNDNVDIFVGDLLKPETYSAALQGVDKALLISSAFEDMVSTQKTFIDAARKAGVSHIVKYSGGCSQIGFIARKFLPMIEHEDIEDYLVNSGLKWTIVRPDQFMEYYLPMTPTGVDLKTDSLILPYNNSKVAPVAITDVAKVCVKILMEDGHENRIYDITGPDAIVMEEACAIISEAIKRKITFNDISLADYEKMLSGMGVQGKTLEILMQISKERRKCIDATIRLDTHKLFGVRPTNFAEFMYRNAAAFN